MAYRRSSSLSDLRSRGAGRQKSHLLPVLALLQSPFADAPPLARQARFFTIVALACVTVFVYWQSFGTIFSLYTKGDYQHHFLVYPVALYLIWRRQNALVTAPAGASLAGTFVLATMVFAWHLARVASVQSVEHGLAIMMIPAVVYAVMGGQVLRALALPMVLLLAAIPLGDVFLSALMEVTADISMVLLNLVGIPTYREGLYLSLPGGDFRVAEACAGLNYLSAGATLALLFSCFAWRRWRPRLIFVAIAAVVFIVGNGLRAFIVMAVASASNMRVLAGHDHVVFGMVLFAVLLLALLWGGMRYADKDHGPDHGQDHGKAESQLVAAEVPLAPYRQKSLPIALGAVVILLAGPAAQAYRDYAGGRLAATLSLPVLAGCIGPGEWRASWSPSALAPSDEMRGSYRCGAIDVNVYGVEYINPQQGRELVAVGNVLVPADWVRRAERQDSELALADGSTLLVNQVNTRRAERAEFAVYWYEVNGKSARSEYAEKLLEARAATSLAPVRSRAFVVSATGPHQRPEVPRARALEVARALASSMAGNAHE